MSRSNRRRPPRAQAPLEFSQTSFAVLRLRPDVPRPPRSTPVAGVNVIGWLTAEMGIGQGARLLLDILAEAGIPFTTYDYEPVPHRRAAVHRPGVGRRRFGVNIVCLNGPELIDFARRPEGAVLRARYTIAQWAFELTKLPDSWLPALLLVDEVWVPSRFVADVVRKSTDKPVRVLPWPITPIAARAAKAEFGLPDRLTFLFCVDYHSTAGRKNPRGVIRAFRKAFAPDEGPLLVVKSINGGDFPRQAAALRRLAGGRPDILLWDGYMDRNRQDLLMASCDCYVSLHRAEGFGLTMAEAMACGKPVIATNYSGNLEFMDATNSFLVPYRMMRVGGGHHPYRADGAWADPDLHAASQAMRRVVADPTFAAALGRRARTEVLRRHGVDRRARLVRDWMSSINTNVTGSHRQERFAEFERLVIPPAKRSALSIWVGAKLRPYPRLHAGTLGAVNAVRAMRRSAAAARRPDPKPPPTRRGARRVRSQA